MSALLDITVNGKTVSSDQIKKGSLCVGLLPENEFREKFDTYFQHKIHKRAIDIYGGTVSVEEEMLSVGSEMRLAVYRSPVKDFVTAESFILSRKNEVFNLKNCSSKIDFSGKYLKFDLENDYVYDFVLFAECNKTMTYVCRRRLITSETIVPNGMPFDFYRQAASQFLDLNQLEADRTICNTSWMMAWATSKFFIIKFLFGKNNGMDVGLFVASNGYVVPIHFRPKEYVRNFVITKFSV